MAAILTAKNLSFFYSFVVIFFKSLNQLQRSKSSTGVKSGERPKGKPGENGDHSGKEEPDKKDVSYQFTFLNLKIIGN